jgi:1-deoxy-D-xylulose-5-phosphate synthase
MADHGYQSRVVRLGIPDEFIEHGSQNQLYKECGYDIDAMVASAKRLVGARSSAGKMVG